MRYPSAASHVILRNKRFGAQQHKDDSASKNKSDESLPSVKSLDQKLLGNRDELTVAVDARQRRSGGAH